MIGNRCLRINLDCNTAIYCCCTCDACLCSHVAEWHRKLKCTMIRAHSKAVSAVSTPLHFEMCLSRPYLPSIPTTVNPSVSRRE